MRVSPPVPRPHDPARLPGHSRRVDVAVTSAMKHPRWLAIVLLVLVAIAAVPALVIMAIARMQGSGR